MSSELFVTRRAFMHDAKGDYHGKKGFKKRDLTFKYGIGRYNVDPKNATVKEDVVIPFLWSRKTYYYNTELSNPLKLDKKMEPPISPRLYNANLEANFIERLNDLPKGKLSDLFSVRNIIIAIIALIIVYFVSQHGKLF